MKTEKYLCETLKAILRGQKVLFYSYGTDVVISKDGCSGILIPKSKNPFNNFVYDNHIIPDDWNKNEMAMMSSTTIIGDTAFCFLKCDHWRTIINEKQLKYFDYKSELTKFYQPVQKHIVYVEERGKLCGIIMPSLVPILDGDL